MPLCVRPESTCWTIIGLYTDRTQPCSASTKKTPPDATTAARRNYAQYCGAISIKIQHDPLGSCRHRAERVLHTGCSDLNDLGDSRQAPRGRLGPGLYASVA